MRIPVCVMSNFKRTSLILVRLKIFEWINCLQVDIYIKFRETELVEVS